MFTYAFHSYIYIDEVVSTNKIFPDVFHAVLRDGHVKPEFDLKDIEGSIN